MGEELVGRDILIPGSAWNPPVDGVVPGYILKKTDPTKRYPSGRFEVVVPGHTNRYLFSVADFDHSWLLETSNLAPKARAKTPSRRSKTPSKARAYDEQPISPTRPTRTPSRGRAAAAAAAAAVTPGSAITAPVQGAGEPQPSIRVLSPSKRRSPSKSPAGRGKSPRRSGRTPASATAGTKSVLRDTTRTPSGRLSTQENARNALLMVAVAVPAVLLGWAVVKADVTSPAVQQPVKWPVEWSEVCTLAWWQRLGLHNPLAFVNLVFLLNVDIGFWLVALIQGNTWLIDPYWTFIPCLIQLFYQLHPFAVVNPWRGIVASTLLRLWAIRLTHSYFRREEWQFGAREDWRFTDLSRKVGRHWWWLSFFATYLTQHAMLVGITLPFAATYTSSARWAPLDSLAALLAITGIVGAWFADTQLYSFMATNRERKAAGLEPVLILDSGLWHYSRHPNYFFEQLWWWGVALWAVRLGHPWYAAGQLFNNLCMVSVTQMTEARMKSKPERAELWEAYQASTSAWVPWFKSKPKEE